MTVIVRPEVGQISKAVGVAFSKDVTEALKSIVDAVKVGFDEDVTVDATKRGGDEKSKEFGAIVSNVYSVMDMVEIARAAGLFTKIPGGSTKPEEIIAGVIASFCSVVRIHGETKFHFEVAANRLEADKTAAGRVLLFAAESFSATIRHKGFRPMYEGAPFDVYNRILEWFYHGK